MSPRRSPSAAPTPPLAVAQRPQRAAHGRVPRKGNSQTEFTAEELEKMVVEAARRRAVGARSRS
jgi:ribosomal protein L13E